jgi:hypothetical protein
LGEPDEDDTGYAPADVDADDDDFIVNEEPRKRAKNMKGSRPRTSKPGAKSSRKSVLMVKDERKPAGTSRGDGPPRPKHLKLDDLIPSTDSTSGTPIQVDASPASALQKADTPPVPKKRKLPTIKKNNGQKSTPKEPSTPKVPDHTLPPMTPVGPGPAGRLKQMSGHADFDLRDKSVYASLFSGVSTVSITSSQSSQSDA